MGVTMTAAAVVARHTSATGAARSGTILRRNVVLMRKLPCDSGGLGDVATGRQPPDSAGPSNSMTQDTVRMRLGCSSRHVASNFTACTSADFVVEMKTPFLTLEPAAKVDVVGTKFPLSKMPKVYFSSEAW